MKKLMVTLSAFTINSAVFAGGLDVRPYCCPKGDTISRFADFIYCSSEARAIPKEEINPADLTKYTCERDQGIDSTSNVEYSKK